MRLSILPDRRWPSGDCVDLALIDVPDDLLEATFGVPFVRGEEPGLGDWVASGGRLPCGAVVEFVRYANASVPGVTVRVDASADLRLALSELLAVGSLRRESLLWWSPRLGA